MHSSSASSRNHCWFINYEWFILGKIIIRDFRQSVYHNCSYIQLYVNGIIWFVLTLSICSNLLLSDLGYVANVCSVGFLIALLYAAYQDFSSSYHIMLSAMKDIRHWWTFNSDPKILKISEHIYTFDLMILTPLNFLKILHIKNIIYCGCAFFICIYFSLNNNNVFKNT